MIVGRVDDRDRAPLPVLYSSTTRDVVLQSPHRRVKTFPSAILPAFWFQDCERCSQSAAIESRALFSDRDRTRPASPAPRQTTRPRYLKPSPPPRDTVLCPQIVSKNSSHRDPELSPSPNAAHFDPLRHSRTRLAKKHRGPR